MSKRPDTNEIRTSLTCFHIEEALVQQPARPLGGLIVVVVAVGGQTGVVGVVVGLGVGIVGVSLVVPLYCCHQGQEHQIISCYQHSHDG